MYLNCLYFRSKNVNQSIQVEFRFNGIKHPKYLEKKDTKNAQILL